ncbi:hypothetical protein EVAR_9770_1 [Eumeta japonica]|uniref:Uncharacterized protein n=1 Tax=Eumeta variegata TaxID=151549 RepID=A0A4C1U5F3_EUMVA|nr:hypothetical protein EVAR_9770_1 [Eumeta japonica]
MIWGAGFYYCFVRRKYHHQHFGDWRFAITQRLGPKPAGPIRRGRPPVTAGDHTRNRRLTCSLRLKFLSVLDTERPLQDITLRKISTRYNPGPLVTKDCSRLWPSRQFTSSEAIKFKSVKILHHKGGRMTKETKSTASDLVQRVRHGRATAAVSG